MAGTERKFTPHLTDADVAQITASLRAVADCSPIVSEATRLRILATRIIAEWEVHLASATPPVKP